MLVKPTLLVAAALLAQPTFAQSTSAPTAAAAAPDPFAQALAAQSVADYARRHHDVRAMIVAAKMLREVPTSDNGGNGGGAPAPFSADGLFDEAAQIAGSDTVLQSQVRLARADTRGVIASVFGKGLLRQVQDVSPRGAYSFNLQASGGQLLRVGAIGEPGTAMGLKMLDTAGHLVCADDRGDYAPVCATTPRAQASYKVELTNRSAKPSRTVILSN
jgi:hypothetical protein